MLACLFTACGSSSSPGISKSPESPSDTGIIMQQIRQATDPPVQISASEGLFAEAEQFLAVGNYRLAANQLHEGIVAFRFETGRVHGHPALAINHSIDALTRLRSRLRKREEVSAGELHKAVAEALILLPDTWRLRGRIDMPAEDNREDEDRTIIVPVNQGN